LYSRVFQLLLMVHDIQGSLIVVDGLYDPR